MPSFFVTGAGRGLGLELVKQLSQLPSSKVSLVFASTRGAPSSALQEVITGSSGRVKHVTLEITEQKSIDAAVATVQAAVGDKGLSVLINNAGVMPWTLDGIQTMTDLMEVFRVNVLSVQMITASFLPILRQSSEKKVFNISTTLGSIAWAPKYTFAATPAYKVTKAALNMLTVQYAVQFADEGFTFVALSPGWLKTDMGSEQADLPVDTGIKAVLEVVLTADQSSNGKFRDIRIAGWEEKPGLNQYSGRDPPW